MYNLLTKPVKDLNIFGMESFLMDLENLGIENMRWIEHFNNLTAEHETLGTWEQENI